MDDYAILPFRTYIQLMKTNWARFISVETTVPTLAPRASAVRFEKRPKSLQSTFGTFFSQLI
jgi:hypothetical protein